MHFYSDVNEFRENVALNALFAFERHLLSDGVIDTWIEEANSCTSNDSGPKPLCNVQMSFFLACVFPHYFVIAKKW